MNSFIGAGFQPYVGPWSGKPPKASVPLYNSYSTSDIETMLNTISGTFGKLATYSAGYASYYTPSTAWNKVDSNCLVAGAAASINKKAGKLVVEVAQGIYQQSSTDLQNAEIAGALSAATAANKTYAGTVTSLIFTNEYCYDEANTKSVLAMINAFKKGNPGAGLKLGVRSNAMGNLTSPYTAPAYKTALEDLVKACDVVLLNIYPPKSCASPKDGMTSVGKTFTSIQSAITQLNSSCEVMIGETGWPSEGTAFDDLTTSNNNLLAYLSLVEAWALKNSVVTYFFEAIDEPWKSDQNASVPPTSPAEGPSGAEGHYGVWTAAVKSGGGYNYTKKAKTS